MSNDSFKYTPDAPPSPVTSSQKIVPLKAPSEADVKIVAKPKYSVPWSPAAAVIFTLVIFFTAQLLGSMLVILFPRLLGWDTAKSNQWLDTSIAAQFWFVLSTEALTFGAIWWFIKARGANLRSIGLRALRWKEPFYALGALLVYFCAYILVITLATQLVPSLDVDQKQELGFQNPATATGLWLTFISLVVLPPLVEEIVFRGFLFTGLRSKIKPLWAGLFTSLLFAAAHLQFGNGKPLLWVAAIDTFILSVVLCYLRQKTGSLWPGILLHAFKNGIAFLSLFVIGAQ